MKKVLSFLLVLCMVSGLLQGYSYQVQANQFVKTDESYELLATQQVTGISLNKTKLYLEDEESYTLVANVTPNDATNKGVTWSSSDTSIASVDQLGVVTAHTKGKAIIKATANDGSGVSKSCNVVVLNNHIYCDSFAELESAHGYEDNSLDEWIYTHKGAERIKVTFDERTEVEDGFDYICIYDNNNEQVGVYTGKQLAGQSVAVEGNTVKIRIESDESWSAWGFKVTKVKGDNDFSITTQPDSKTIREGEKAVFSIVAKGKELKYQWQYSSDGSNWTNSGMTGAKTASLTVVGTAARNGQMYRCVVTDTEGDTEISSAALLTVKPPKIPLQILSQPISKTILEGETTVFYVEAKGEGLTYQWQYSSDGKTWANSGMTGSQTDSLTVEGLKKRDGQQYRCIITDVDGEKITSKAAKLTVKIELKILTQPIPKTVKEGEAAVFSVETIGDEVTYQWQFSTDGITWTNSGMTDAQTKSLTVEALAKRNGQYYRCIITDKDGNQLESDAVQLTIIEKAKIVTHPASKKVKEGDIVIFNVVAKGEELSYQWQYSTDGTKWIDSGAEGAKTDSLSVEGQARRNGQQYRCVVTDVDGNKATSNAATLTVKEAIKITIQPVSQIVEEGKKAIFTVEAQGEGLTYQWQYKAVDKTDWRNSGMEGSKTASLSVECLASRNGQQYRCEVTDADGEKVISNEVQLTVRPPKVELSILSHPESQNVEEGETAVFSVEAQGEGLTYQWQYKAVDSEEWKNSGMEGSKTESLSVKGLITRNGQQYRCEVTDVDGIKLISEAATLTIGNPKVELAIITEPESQTIEEGQTAVFSIEAQGDGLTYQWQYKSATVTEWKNSGMTGADTASLSVVGTKVRNGQQYRCVVTDAEGNNVTSKAATLTIGIPKPTLVITVEPESKTIQEGEKAVFTVEADGEGLTYQWQFSKDNGATWGNSGMTGAKTASLTVEGTLARNGQQYRCVVTNTEGNKVTSKAAILTVGPAKAVLAIVTDPTNQSVKVGEKATFSVVAKGEGLTYQWQYKSATATEWKNSGMTGADTANLSVEGTKARNGQQYRCVITDENGETVTSKAASLSVTQ